MRKSISLLALLAALGVLAVTAASASATIVTPANEAIELVQIRQEPGFVSANAYAETAVQCKNASATFTTPDNKFPPTGTAANRNQPEVGAFSTGNGSVTFPLSSQTFGPECFLYEWNGTEWEILAPATVKTSGTWSVAATNGVAGSGVVSIALPPGAATIEIPAIACTINVSPGQATAVGALYLNLTKELQVDGQVPFEAEGGCAALPSPAQFEAAFRANKKFEIN